MNFKTKHLLFFFLTLSLLYSCSIEKRHYMNGYHVSGIKKNTSASKIAPNKQDAKVGTNMVEYETEMASIDNNIIVLKSENRFTINVMATEVCDLIVLKNGDEIKGKVTDIGLQEIKYKKCDNLDGPSISILKSDVFMIKYPNGTKDIINKIGSNINDNNSTNSNSSVPIENGNPNSGNNKTEVKKLYYSAADGGGLLSEMPMSNGKINGLYKMYYKGGALMSEMSYVDNITNGMTKMYYESGKVMTESPMLNGKINGNYILYDEKGNIVSQTNYINGEAGKTVMPAIDKINKNTKMSKKWSIFKVLGLVFFILFCVLWAIDGLLFAFYNVPLSIVVLVCLALVFLLGLLHKSWVKKQIAKEG